MERQDSVTSFTLADIYFTVIGVESGIAVILMDQLIEESPLLKKRAANAPQFFGIYKQLHEYFKGKRFSFDIPLSVYGTPFQNKVWAQLLKIPYGKTVSYKHIAQKIKNPQAVRAVGRANGLNPVPIIIPCHRVVNNDGGLGGYSGGIETKQRLLDLEMKFSKKP